MIIGGRRRYGERRSVWVRWRERRGLVARGKDVTKGFKHIVKTLLSRTFMHSKMDTPPLAGAALVPTSRSPGIEFYMEIAVVPENTKELRAS